MTLDAWGASECHIITGSVKVKNFFRKWFLLRENCFSLTENNLPSMENNLPQRENILPQTENNLPQTDTCGNRIRQSGYYFYFSASNGSHNGSHERKLLSLKRIHMFVWRSPSENNLLQTDTCGNRIRQSGYYLQFSPSNGSHNGSHEWKLLSLKQIHMSVWLSPFTIPSTDSVDFHIVSHSWDPFVGLRFFKKWTIFAHRAVFTSSNLVGAPCCHISLFGLL